MEAGVGAGGWDVLRRWRRVWRVVAVWNFVCFRGWGEGKKEERE